MAIKQKNSITYKDSIVVFLDILGFKELVNKSYHEKKGTNIEVLNDIYRAMQTIRSILGLDQPELQFKGYFATSFSDCIVISFPYKKPDALFDLIYDIQVLLINLNHQHIITRGAITRGMIYADPENQIVFGPGLVEAYELESAAAHYPRIILDREILELCLNTPGIYKTEEKEEHLRNMLEIDTDGMYFVNYFQPIGGNLIGMNYDYAKQLIRTREIIVSGLRIRKPGVRIKYEWMRNKFNIVLKHMGEPDRVALISDLRRDQIFEKISKIQPI